MAHRKIKAVSEVGCCTCVDPTVDLRIKGGSDLDKVVFLRSAAVSVSSVESYEG